jgi:hypothetical protein
MGAAAVEEIGAPAAGELVAALQEAAAELRRLRESLAGTVTPAGSGGANDG